MVNFLFMRTALYLITLISLVACGHADRADDAYIANVKVATVESLDLIRRDFAAMSTADDAVNLAFKISGRVIDIPVAKGMLVSRGQLLAELDKRDVQLQVDAAKAVYDEAQSRLKRAKRLAEHNAISQQEVETLVSSVEQARTVYENALELLNDTRIVAPFDGVVERTYVDAFQRVASGEVVVRIVRPVSTTVGFTAPEDIVIRLADPTTRFSVRFDAYPNITFNATIKSFARTTSDARGYPVSLRLVDVDSARYRITPGMTCMATVELSASDSGAVRVPITAIYAPIGGDDYVWVIGKDNIVERRRVVLGELTGENSVIIVDGLKAGERVVSAGVYHLTNGERVRLL
jgi:RND family efflux transporter MFP subunit